MPSRPTGWHIRNAPWFSRLFEDPAFAARVKLAWNEIKADELPAMFQAITTSSASLQQPQLNNFQRWPILETYVWPNYRIPGSYAGEIDYLNDLADGAHHVDGSGRSIPERTHSSPRSANDRQLLSPTMR